MRFKKIAIAAVPLVVLLASCGSNETAKFNDDDVMFVQGMISHHEQAIEMADMALVGSADASVNVKDLGQRVKDAQDPEIKLMKSWLQAWDKPLEMDSSDAHSMGGADSGGMMSDEEMGSLKGMMGSEFDTTWLGLMMKHHQGALDMAIAIKKNGTNSDVIDLADRIIAGQTAEITEMEHMLNN